MNHNCIGNGCRHPGCVNNPNNRHAPRCPKCGTRLPLHAAGCPEIPKPETEPTGLDAVSRPPYEVTQVSKFTEES